MKNSKTTVIYLLISILALFSACRKEDPEPEIFVKARLLAGLEGQSKTWLMTNFFYKVENANEIDLFDAPELDCSEDDLYTFSNNSEQTCVVTAGATKCIDYGDEAEKIETGNWLLRRDAGRLMLSFTGGDASISQFVLYASDEAEWETGGLCEITKLTETEMELKVNFINFEDKPATFRYIFIKK
jgi:hypothetical protein